MKVRAVLIDLEGTLYWKGAKIEGADEAVDAVRKMAVDVLFLTNNDSKANSTLVADLAKLRLVVPEKEVFTCADAAVDFLSKEEKNRCFCVVSHDLAAKFSSFEESTAAVDFVVVGDPRERFTYDMANRAFRHLLGGAKLLALQKGRYFTREDGAFIDTGGFVAMLEYATGQPARVVGKPSSLFYSAALERIGCKGEEVLVVGDDIATDILGGREIGARTVLVRTDKGESNNGKDGDIAPDFVIRSIQDLPRLVEEVMGY